MEIKIAIPEDHKAELRYVIDVLFGEVLGANYRCETRPVITDVLIFVGEKKMIFQDHFFSKLLDMQNYLNEKYLPPKVRFLEYGDDLVPILYGHDYLYRGDKMTVCGLDIFGSLFFLLTAWEEEARKYIVDQHGYFPFNASWIWKNEVHERDILKEYAELLLSLLEEIGFDKKSLNVQFSKPVIYVLVEDLQHFKNNREVVGIGDMFLKPRKYIHEKKKWNAFKDTKVDPWNNLKQWWNFGKENNREVRFLISQSLSAKHVEKVKSFALKKESELGVFLFEEDKVVGFSDYSPVMIDITYRTLQGSWSFLHDQKVSTSMNSFFTNYQGNRCGTTLPFPIFDISKRRVLDLIELPISSYHFYNDQDPDENSDRDFVLSNSPQNSFLISNLLFED